MIGEWFGWLWIDEQWHRVCRGSTLASCSATLGVEARRRGIKDKYAVMTQGGAPTFIPVGSASWVGESP